MGGGGTITDGATQWMTAGAGIVHSEMPPEYLVRRGGLFHGVQLWVNLPATLKWIPPRYQDIGRARSRSSPRPTAAPWSASSPASSTAMPGRASTYTPIAYAHATLHPEARLEVPLTSPTWRTLPVVMRSASVSVIPTAPLG